MPRKYTIKDPEAYRKTRLAGLERIRELGKGSMGGCFKGKHKPYKHHAGNPSAGEARTGLFVLASSSEVINACARARGITNLAFVKELTDKLRRSKEFRHLFRKRRKEPCSGVASSLPSASADSQSHPLNFG